MLSVRRRELVPAATLRDLERTDWDGPPTVHIDEGPSDRFPPSVVNASFEMLRTALENDAPMILYLEDDLRFNRFIRHNLEQWSPLASLGPRQHFFASLYNPGSRAELRNEDEHYLVADPVCFLSSQALLLSENTVQYVLDHWWEEEGFPDLRMARLAARVTPLLLHYPSLVQHVGFDSSFGHPYGRASDFRPDWRSRACGPP